jgi:mannose-6-phosphate isomerase-like protein (cupin superfamily)
MNSNALKETITAWQAFLAQHPWQTLIKNVTPKEIGCGRVYELPNFLNRPNESLAIADMRHIPFSEPHYHPKGNTEIYFVLAGHALVVVGNKERKVQPGDVITIPPLTAHYAVPDKEFVIAAVIMPPFQPDHYVVLTHTEPAVHFNEEQFKKLIKPVSLK